MHPAKRMIFMVLAVTLAAAVLEGSARVVRTVRKAPVRTRPRGPMLQPDALLHHRWVSSLKVQDTSREVPYWLITNRQGWVETDDVPQAKPAGTYRVFYVGDSNTQGVVPPQDKMVESVERELQQEYLGSGRRIEVINAGTSSYSFLLYYLQIKNEILPYDPDLVIINVDMTDVVNDYVYRKTRVVDGDGEVLAVLPSTHIDTTRYRMTPSGIVELHACAPLQHWLVNHSAFCYYQDRLWQHVAGGTRADNAVDGMLDRRANWLALEWTAEIDANVAASMGTLQRTLRLLRSHGVRAMVTGVPHYPQFSGEWSARPHQALAEAVAAEGACYLDAYAALKGIVGGTPVERYYWGSDPTHFNAAGNRIWADAQLAFLRRHRPELLPQRSTE